MLKTILLSSVMVIAMNACGNKSTTKTNTDPINPQSTTPTGVSDPAGTGVDPDPVDPNPVDPDPVDPPEPNPSIAIEFNANDVSILFPAPATSAELNANIIRLTDFDSDKVLPANLFQQTMALATGQSMLTIPNPAGDTPPTIQIPVRAGEVRTPDGQIRSIKFPGQNLRSDWALAGIRIDPGAPGLSEDIFDHFGKSPQIRLILQPIKESGGNVNITDGSLHLVYAFHGPDDAASVAACRLHNTPDMDNFKKAVADLKAIKEKMETDHGIVTDGRALGVHPAFASAGSEFKAEIQTYLNEYLTTDRLFAVSIAAIPLPAPEPWVFVAMQKSPLSGNIEAVPGPGIIQPDRAPRFGQMISFIDNQQIDPAPATRNQLPIDCGFNLTGQVPAQVDGAGVSTAMVFDRDPNVNPPVRMANVGAIIADATASHFFNTDCVSCHTETRKQIDEGQGTAASIGAEAGIDPAVIPNGNWNVRAFGWGPLSLFGTTPGAHNTITRRAATETAEVIECFETERWASVTESCLR